MRIPAADEAILATVRLECVGVDGRVQLGTGFVFELLENSDETLVLGIVTCRHVVEGAQRVYAHISSAREDASLIPGFHQRVQLEDVHRGCQFHPDSGVDLAVFPANDTFHKLLQRGYRPGVRVIGPDLILSSEQAIKLSSLEEIIMIGYPNGLWDAVNNRPVARRGLTASALNRDWNGRREFLVDAACFPGSSGSPVFVTVPVNPVDAPNNEDKKLVLAGILSSAPVAAEEVTVPSDRSGVSAKGEVSQFLHLGTVIKADRLLELAAHVSFVIDAERAGVNARSV
jgi:hypothetical protein